MDRVLSALLPPPIATSTNDKIVKDLIWGIITLPGFLVPLIDSRLMQRQRRIRQLGFSYLVYPSAGYSRFEHALGCCHVMQALLRAVEANSKSLPAYARPAPLSEARRKQLLIGALLHDVGHMPFSHASEECVEEFCSQLKIGSVSVEDLLADVNDVTEKKLHLAEFLSILVVLAPHFRNFMKAVVPTVPEHSDFFLETAAFIAGARLSSMDLAYSLVLSGPLDADRLDYMIRDATVTGVPVSVDIPRLLARCAFILVSTTTLPEGMRRSDDPAMSMLFVTDLSGANALEELAVSRFMLNDRIYNHQKTQAAQAVLTELIHRSFDAKHFGTDLLRFWAMTDESFLHFAAEQEATAKLAQKLLFRELPKRAMVLGNNQVVRPSPPATFFEDQPSVETTAGREEETGSAIDEQVGELLDRVDEDFRVFSRREALQNEIAQEAKTLSTLVPEQYRPTIPLELVVVRHRPQNPFNTVGEAIVVDQDFDITKFKSHMPIGQWSAVYDLNKKFGFIYCDVGWEYLVHIAAELILWKRYRREDGNLDVRFRLTPGAVRRSKLSFAQMTRIKEHLDKSGIFDGARLLRPLTIDEDRLNRLSERFRFFQGANGWGVTSQTLANFVKQFPTRLQAQVCQLLESTEFLDRGKLTGALRRQLERLCEEFKGKKIKVVPLTPNSGNLIRMLLEGDVRAALEPSVEFQRTDISQFIPCGEPLVFVDDVFTSGSQAASQLQALMGIPPKNRADPRETNIFEPKLSDEQTGFLKTHPVRCIFASGTPEGAAAIESAASSSGLKDFAVFFDQAIARADIAVRFGVELTNFLASVGEQVLATARRTPGAESNKTDALGYGGRSGLIVSTFNAPTCCPPAVWCPGTVHDSPWIPLFIRRGYQKNAVVN